MTQKVGEFELGIRQIGGYEFAVRFDKEQYAELRLDEPKPLGSDVAPNAARILAAAIGNCLAASLVFCLQKSGTALSGVEAKVKVELVRNDNRRLRIGRVDVVLAPHLEAETEAYQKCLGSFEDFCVVTQSVREGLDVHVSVEPVVG